MLTLILGRAGSGKTSYIMEGIRRRAEKGQKSVLIIPEQYSHDAERQLCDFCGDSVSLFAEVLSFSRLTNRVLAETGGLPGKTLDAGGRVLVMSLAVAAVSSKLSVYNVGRRADFLEGLLRAYDEFKTANIAQDSLEKAASLLEGSLAKKLCDLGLIFGAFEALVPDGMCDRTEIMCRLAESIDKSSLGGEEHIYIDGFTDFTEQEAAVVEKLLNKGAGMTICLTCDGLEGDGTEFALPRKTALRLLREAMERGVRTEIINHGNDARSRTPELKFLDENILKWPQKIYGGKNEAVVLFKSSSVAEECENAAAVVRRLVRSGYRYRDIAVVARNWGAYDRTAAGIFEKYGVPVLVAEKSPILEKPVMAIVTSALDIIVNNWDYVSVFKYLKTDLAGISLEERDALENYVLKWNIRGASMWTREDDWIFDPSGFTAEMEETDREMLSLVNAVRKKAAKPLFELQNRLKNAENVAAQVRALYDFLVSVGLSERISEKAEALYKSGDRQTADEYEKLWDILISAMEQQSAIMGAEKLDAEELAGHFKLLLSEYDVGTIPAALDRVSMGPMDRTKRRLVKCLIVVGASDDMLPDLSPRGGILSESERDELSKFGLGLADTAETRISRELNLIYSSLTLPSEKLFISYPAEGESGRPSFIMSRLSAMFGEKICPISEDIRTEAPMPCFEIAVGQDTEQAKAAAEYFKNAPEWRAKYEAAQRAALISRGTLSSDSAKKLYGGKLNLTASRVDKFYSCRFSYFLQYGLRAKSRKPAGFDAPNAGTFMHFVLENTVREAEASGGFGVLDENMLRAVTKKYVKKYAENVMDGFRDKSERFKYLFTRLASDAERIVLDMAEELADSDFKPMAFELNFSRGGDLPPAELQEGGVSVAVSGQVDRVDGWIKGDKLYLRVIDYKTGKKAFSLSDVWYGMGMQMLIYLFVLQKSGTKKFSREIVPAGVIYAPARDVILSVPAESSDEDIAKERAKKLIRSGLLLKDPEVIEAMEHGAHSKYLPVKFTKDGAPTGENLATADKLGKLSAHINRTLLEMGREMGDGVIQADPYYRGKSDNACLFCDYFEACHFNDDTDKRRFLTKLKPHEAWNKIEGVEDNG